MNDAIKNKTKSKWVVAVVGATGAVGQELLTVLSERRFPVAELVPLASARSLGESVEWRGHDVAIEVLEEDSFAGVDIAFFSAGGAISERFVPLAVEAGAVVVDNTSAFRMRDDVPLVVPEVNVEALDAHQGIIANPNCSTAQLVMALKPLHDVAGLTRVVCSTYQAASGAGRAAMDELRDQTIALLSFKQPRVKCFPRRLAFDVLPEIDTLLDNGNTREEQKMVEESQKILGLPALGVSATCVRVPVFVGHCVSVNAAFERPVDVATAQAALASFPGVKVAEGPGDYTTGAECAGDDDVHVGRLRADASCTHGLNFWVTADNLRKGAATNAVQIGEALIARGLLKRAVH